MSRPPTVSNSFKSRQIEITDQLIIGNGIRSVTPTSSINLSGTTFVDVSTSAPALRVTQRGLGNVVEFEDSQTPDSTLFKITNSGEVVIGTTSSTIPDTAMLNLVTSKRAANIFDYGQSDLAPAFYFHKTRGSDFNQHALLSSSDNIVVFSANVSNGINQYAQIARFDIDMDPSGGAPTPLSLPSRIQFSTTSTASTAVQARLTINHLGYLGIDTQTPNERLTVVGNISATGAIYTQGPILSSGIDLFDIFTTGAAASGIQNLTFNEGNFNLSISEGNTVSLTALAVTTSIASVSSNLTTIISAVSSTLNTTIATVSSNLTTTISAVSSTLNTTIANLTAALPSTINTFLSTSSVTINALTVTTGITAQSANIPVTVIDLTASRTFNNSDTNKVFHFNTTSNSLCAIVPGSLSNGFNIAILNTGTNSLVISAENLRSAGTTIVDQFGGAYIYKQNNNVFAVGRLF